MIVDFTTENDETKTVHVGLDYMMNKVYFLDKTLENIDYNELEKIILASVAPNDCELPEIPEDLLVKVSEIRQGKFDNQKIFNEQEDAF